MNSLLHAMTDFIKNEAWLFHIVLLILITTVVSYIINRVYKAVLPKLMQTRVIWDNALAEALHRPLLCFIWFSVVNFVIQLLGDQFLGRPILPREDAIFQVITIIFIVWFCLRFVNRLQTIIYSAPLQSSRKKYDRTMATALFQVCRVIVIIFAVFSLLQAFGIGVSSLLAFGGVGALGVSFAARDTLANFLGGMMIFVDRPFSVGDSIRSPDRKIEGTVEHIGWRLTRIRTFDMRPLYVPNGIFSTISLENPSRMLNRRIRAEIGVRYKDSNKLSELLKEIEQTLRDHPEIDTKRTLMVNLCRFDASSLTFLIYCFTKTTNWVKFQAVQQDVFLIIHKIIQKHGAQCAFPTTTLDMPEGVFDHLHKESQTNAD